MIPSNSANFFGVISDTPFTTVRLINPAGDASITEGIGIDNLVIGQVAAVPEPNSLISAALGVLGLAGYAG
jgi:hypothetical protein